MVAAGMAASIGTELKPRTWISLWPPAALLLQPAGIASSDGLLTLLSVLEAGVICFSPRRLRRECDEGVYCDYRLPLSVCRITSTSLPQGHRIQYGLTERSRQRQHRTKHQSANNKLPI
jgi:hypothetical protein